MSFQVNATAISTFRNNVELALQQSTSKLAMLAMQENYSGELAEITNLIGSVKPQQADVRHGDTKYVNTPHDRRWMAKPVEQYYADLVDTADRLAAGIDLQGAYVKAGAATIQRAWDDAWIAGYYGTALTGKTGTTQVTFPAGNIIGVNVGAAAPTGLNIAKVRAARMRLMANLVDTDNDELFLGATSVQIDNLLNEVQVTSGDFVSNRERTAIETGKVSTLFGFTIVPVEYGNTGSFNNAGLTVDSNGYRLVPAWAKSGMAMGWWDRSNTSIDRLPQKQNSVQVFAGTTVAASRTQEGKCLLIRCSEA